MKRRIWSSPPPLRKLPARCDHGVRFAKATCFTVTSRPKMSLSLVGYNVIDAEDGSIALERLKNSEQVDVIVLDRIML